MGLACEFVAYQIGVMLPKFASHSSAFFGRGLKVQKGLRLIQPANLSTTWRSSGLHAYLTINFQLLTCKTMKYSCISVPCKTVKTAGGEQVEGDKDAKQIIFVHQPTKQAECEVFKPEKINITFNDVKGVCFCFSYCVPSIIPMHTRK